jgi:hypothetical protein
MGVRIKLLLLHWLDEKGKNKENKIKIMCQSPQYVCFVICFQEVKLKKAYYIEKGVCTTKVPNVQ